MESTRVKPRLRVLHVIPSLDPGDGGPSAALPLMARALADAGLEVTVAATDAGARPTLAQEGNPTYHFFRRQTRFYKFSWPLTWWLARHVGDYDAVHIHALFSYSSVAAGWLACWRRVPFVVRPLGVLNQWGRRNRRPGLKQLSIRWVEMPILRRMAAMQFTSQQEQTEAAEAHPAIARLPSAVIPLGIDLTALDAPAKPDAFFQRFPQAVGRPTVLFLSRLDPKKGLDLLLPAFAEVRRTVSDALLVIAGEGDPDFVQGLHAQAQTLGLADDVLWTGFLAGAEKSAAFAAATVFALPSRSENFGIAAAEALACGVPSVLSLPVAIAADAAAAGAAVAVPCELGPLTNALTTLLREPETRQRLSVRARQHVRERYSPEATAAQLIELYRSISSAPLPRSESDT